MAPAAEQGVGGVASVVQAVQACLSNLLMIQQTVQPELFQ
jgi:hypothetical protein